MSLDRWRSWNASKLPGRAVCRYIRGWTSTRAVIEVHRTACIVTHPPGGEHANDALVNPANERLAGTRFSAEECWRHLYDDPVQGRWDEKYATFPFQTIDGLVTEFGGEELRRVLEAQPADITGIRCPTGGAVVTRSYGEIREVYGHIIHAVPPFYRALALEEEWKETSVSTYQAAFNAATDAGLSTLAVPLLGTGARGVDLPESEGIWVAAQAAVSWCDQKVAPERITVRFGVQSSTLANGLADALETAMRSTRNVSFEPA